MSFPSLSLEDPIPKVQKFLDEHSEQWADEEIAGAMREVAQAANMSQNYIDGIKIVKIKFATIKIFNDHPHARKIEYGTKPHKIRTKGGRGARNSPKALKIPKKFKGGILDNVNHPGTRPMLIMTKGWEIGLIRWRARVKREKLIFEDNMK